MTDLEFFKVQARLSPKPRPMEKEYIKLIQYDNFVFTQICYLCNKQDITVHLSLFLSYHYSLLATRNLVTKRLEATSINA